MLFSKLISSQDPRIKPIIWKTLSNPLSAMRPIQFNYELEKIYIDNQLSEEEFKALNKSKQRQLIEIYLEKEIKLNATKKLNEIGISTNDKTIDLKICPHYCKCFNTKKGNIFTMIIDCKDNTKKQFDFCYHCKGEYINLFFHSIDGEIKILNDKVNGTSSLNFKTFYPAKLNNNTNLLASSFPSDMVGKPEDENILTYIKDNSKIFEMKQDFEHNPIDFPETMISPKENIVSQNWKPPKIDIKPKRSSSPIMMVKSELTRSESLVSVNSTSSKQSEIIEADLSGLSSSPRLEQLEKDLKEEFPFLELEESTTSAPLLKSILLLIFKSFKELDDKFQSERDKVQILKVNQGIVQQDILNLKNENEKLKNELSIYTKEFHFFKPIQDGEKDEDEDESYNKDNEEDDNDLLDIY